MRSRSSGGRLLAFVILLLAGVGARVWPRQHSSGSVPLSSPRAPDNASSVPLVGGLVRTAKELHFNLLVAGLSGLGKTTTCEMLFHGWTSGSHSTALGPLPSTRFIDAHRTFHKEDVASNTRLIVRIIDTPGYGDELDNKRALRPICKYARDALSRQYARERSAAGGHAHAEQQLHCLLYFVSPHRLLNTDRLFLQTLQRHMPVVVVIAKADTLTDDELALQRAQMRRELRACGVAVYDFLEGGGGESDLARAAVTGEGRTAELAGSAGADEAAMERALVGPRYSRGRRPADPLAVLSRGADYPWGSVSAADPAHSDSPLLQQLLLSHHTERLIELARARYRAYRAVRVRREQLRRLLGSAVLLALLGGRAGLRLPAAWEQQLAALLARVRLPTALLGALRELLDRLAADEGGAAQPGRARRSFWGSRGACALGGRRSDVAGKQRAQPARGTRRISRWFSPGGIANSDSH